MRVQRKEYARREKEEEKGGRDRRGALREGGMRKRRN